ncbi:hypothetical protein DFH29DRAFT_789671, partial [Suillus ampliporus]
RISFDVLRSEDIDTILTTPPYVNHHTYHATRPRFVEPTYGGEIAIGGCEVLQNPQAQFNMELRKKYGQDVVCFSRVALKGSTYTVVLRDWQTTNQFLEDFGEGLPSSWTRFRNITVGVPDLLYLFNSVGAPANPSRGAASSSPQVTHLQVQVDELRRQGAETVGTVNQVLAQTWRAVEKQNEVAQQMMASICTVSTSAALSSRYASLESTCGHLEERMVHYHETLEGKPSPAQRIRLDSLLAETEHEYGRVDKEKDTIAQQLSALQFAQGTQFLGQTVPHHNDADPSRPPEHGDDVPMSHERPPPEEDDNQCYEPRQRMSHDGGSAGPSIDANRMEQEVCWPSTVPFTSLLTVTCPLFHSEWVDSGRGQSMVHERAKCRLVPASFSVIRFFFAFTQWLLALALLVSSSAFVILFSLLLLVMVVHASHPLHIVSLNANGVGDLMKCHTISSMIHQHWPHIWVINETKSPTPAASRVRAPGYNTYENSGVQTVGSPAHGKWGVILGVSNTIHAQCVDTSFDLSLTGRVVAVDLVIPTTNGAGPDPQSSSAFWPSITKLCQQSPYSWSLIGDCNVTLNITETSSRSTSLSQAQLQYRMFLRDCHAVDVWDAQNDADAALTYTFHNHLGQSVIDRAVHSTDAPDGQHPVFPSSLTNSTNRHVRPLYPKCHERARFIAFSNEVDHQLLLRGLSDASVADDSSFDVLYHALTDIICDAASLHFEQPRWLTRKQGGTHKILNPTIRILVREGHRLGRLIAATRAHRISELAVKAPWVLNYLNAHRHILIAQWECAPQFLQYLLTLRHTLACIRYIEERQELRSQAQQSAQGHIRAVLMGSSAKSLYPQESRGGLPLALVHPGDRLKFFTSPEDIQWETRTYFTDLFTRQDHPAVQKPWMETPSVIAIKSRTSQDPFTWPVAMTVESLHATLRKGNPRPSPGPDRWEKWCVKSLSDTALCLVLQLVNYEICNSHFPASVKPTNMTTIWRQRSCNTIYKRGPKTSLANYRGICCRRDLTSFLSQLESWSNRHHKSLYLLRRDQQKGFDKLEPQGFYDAISAYGLPHSIVDFDSSAQSEVP